MFNDVLAVILGGGRGTRLWPLTKMRAKPAVPFAGKYRLVDIPISNCLHSGIHQIAILTQFLSVSLHRHITQTYRFDQFHGGWVQLLAAEQTLNSGQDLSASWYQGTADAVRKQIGEIQNSRAKYVLILAGDHLYRMDYRKFIDHHIETGAQISIAVKPISHRDAHRFGIVKLDQGQCVKFIEKPSEDAVIRSFYSREDAERPVLGSMGIYIFDMEVLVELLKDNAKDDFGRDILPQALSTHKVMGYEFDGYWEDIGTIRSFYEANMMLTQENPKFSFLDPQPIYTHQRFLPCSTLVDVDFQQIWLAEGAIIHKAAVKHSVIGVRSIIKEGSVVRDTVICGNDFYESETKGQIPIGIGENSIIRKAIIDKNVRIGKNVIIGPFEDGVNIDEELYYVRDGIVIIPKNAVIPSGTIITP